MTIRQRRRMGVTFRNVRQILKGMDVNDRSPEELSVEVLGLLLAEAPDAREDAAIDWDRLLAFIEKLIELIIRLFL